MSNLEYGESKNTNKTNKINQFAKSTTLLNLIFSWHKRAHSVQLLDQNCCNKTTCSTDL